MAKIGQDGAHGVFGFWPKDIRERIILKTQLNPPKRKEGNPKDPPLASESLLKFLRAEGGVRGTRLSPPPAAIALMAEVHTRAQRRGHMRRALLKASKNKTALGKLLDSGALSRLAPAVRQDLDREDAMLKLLEGLGEDIDEILRKQANDTQGKGS